LNEKIPKIGLPKGGPKGNDGVLNEKIPKIGIPKGGSKGNDGVMNEGNEGGHVVENSSGTVVGKSQKLSKTEKKSIKVIEMESQAPTLSVVHGTEPAAGKVDTPSGRCTRKESTIRKMKPAG
jgi:hypothetical protein